MDYGWQDVALKVLPPQFSQDHSRLQRFKRKARSATALNHPNICTIYEVGEEEGTAFIAMEHIEGRPLANVIAARPLEMKQVLEIAIQVAEALEQARKQNIVHRDIKPGNILITPQGRVKVLDFGLAKMIESQKGLSDASTHHN